ncbi:exocyst complex component Sec5-domain-containing protein [Protomyces lactucae-debilis]|uniref:Exocyst complex component SEC5 n=1 Tax=Protomyces lactucae-debilis TaxID=2754530 RepID=A0A1Y2F958_PROLT|nr:exocyst complex component Sec5-domain-containing protein [Protomyces lactucae-debilis]ORY80450.1 exocyst complex component Sec5-domain-containing protein [Protomyces lactucae-debilis]
MADPILAFYGITSHAPDVWQDVDQSTVRNSVSSTTKEVLGLDTNIPASLSAAGILRGGDVPTEYQVSSKHFNARSYIRDVHRKATPNDLKRGQANLLREIEDKSGSLRSLVEDNFDRFVGSKGTIDDVYAQISSEFLKRTPATNKSPVKEMPTYMRRPSAFQKDKKEEPEGGITDQVKDKLYDCSARAAQIFEPMVESKRKADKLKMSLGILDRYSEHFALPSVLMNRIERGDTDGLLKAFKQGSTLYDETHKSLSSANPSSAAASKRDIRALARVWAEVERVMKAYEQTLLRSLDTLEKPDRIVKTCNTLLELGVAENPYLRAYTQSVARVKEESSVALQRTRTHVEILRRNVEIPRLKGSAVEQKKTRITALHNFISAELSPASATKLPMTESALTLDMGEVANFWKALDALVDSLWTTQVQRIAESWSVVQEFCGTGSGLSGGTRPLNLLPSGPQGSSKRHHIFSATERQAVSTQAEECVAALCTHFAEFWLSKPIKDLPSIYSPASVSESPVTPQTSTEGPTLPTLPPDAADAEFSFLTGYATSVSTVVRLTHIMTLIMDGAHTLKSLRISSKIDDACRSLVTSIRERFIRAVCEAWQADCEHLPHLETWHKLAHQNVLPGATPPPQARPTTQVDGTAFPQVFFALQKALVDGIRALAYANGAGSQTGSPDMVLGLSQRLVGNIRQQFFKNVYTVTNGLMTLTYQQPPLVMYLEADVVLADLDVDAKKLLTLANLGVMRHSTVERMVNSFESAFQVGITEDVGKIASMLKQYDDKIFSNFGKQKALELEGIVLGHFNDISTSQQTRPADSSAETTTKFDVLRLPLPTDVSSYAYNLVLLLVKVHAQVSNATPLLLQRLLTYLVDYVYETFASGLRSLCKKCTLGAYMTFSIDLEFLNLVLSSYVSTRAMQTAERLFQEFGGRLVEEAESGRQKEEPDVKRILSRARRAVMTQTRVFRLEEK